MRARLLLPLLISLLLCGCGEGEYTYDLFAMNTVISLRFTADDQTEADTIARSCEALIADIEQQTSRTIETSDISRFNASESGIPLGEHSRAIVETALEISSLTDGAYDITVAPLVELWDVTSETPCIPETAEITAALARVGYEQLTLDGDILNKSAPSCTIDLGSIAKGYALGKTAEL
ncbi:MAG: FAD:protein FMN transferase, partial [Clostridia bacterium]|nr:FAD:protein FMN transferase [Clostridia bacterium]